MTTTTIPATGFIAGITYPSGREIYVGRRPELAEWTESAAAAHVWPTYEDASQAVRDLKASFRLRSPKLLPAFIVSAPAF